jgi:phospholipid/cholesterol/gamma-HCH transport system ATP-binding protein
MAHNPRIILYDEPTTGLDPVTTSNIEELIIKVHCELKVTTVIVTHQMNTVYRCCHRIVMLADGKLIETGNPEETKNTQNETVRKFIWGGL